MGTVRVDTNLQTAASLLLPSPASVSQLRSQHSQPCLQLSGLPGQSYQVSVISLINNISKMMATISRMSHPLRNTARMESDNILNRQVGRNTKYSHGYSLHKANHTSCLGAIEGGDDIDTGEVNEEQGEDGKPVIVSDANKLILAIRSGV